MLTCLAYQIPNGQKPQSCHPKHYGGRKLADKPSSQIGSRPTKLQATPEQAPPVRQRTTLSKAPSFPGPQVLKASVCLRKGKEWLCKEGPVIDFPCQYLLLLSNFTWDNGFPCFRDQIIFQILKMHASPSPC